MQIILLSGGSGKRLWPLSNNTQSKQFIKQLTAPDGSKESMVQRVVRQLREAGICDSITVATSQSQWDVIINQHGDEIPVVTEPERRNTFPAIALASSYLAYERKCPADEIVVVMPCDPYTEAGYFETIRKMVDAVANDMAELVLMGIKPTYSSAKYGYIVPVADDTNTEIYKVSRFTEKPDVSTAKKFISEGAFWNGGVFAFRLGYMTEIAARYIKTDNFAEIRSRYGEFPKISFDYEVAEKVQSVAVIPFAGEWKDLGTWNTDNRCTFRTPYRWGGRLLDERTLRGFLHHLHFSGHRLDGSRRQDNGQTLRCRMQVFGRHILSRLYHPLPAGLYLYGMGIQPPGDACRRPSLHVAHFRRSLRSCLCLPEVLRPSGAQMAHGAVLKEKANAIINTLCIFVGE